MSRLHHLVIAAVAVVVLAAPLGAAPVTEVKGEVVDLECSLEKGAAGQGEAHAACAMACAKDGKLMAILADDAVYVIEGDYTANKNAKLLDFVAKKVMAKGELREHDGRKYLRVVAMTVQPTIVRK